MPRDDNIKTVIINVHLGRVPTFDARANDDVAASGDTDSNAACNGAGLANADLLQELLAKIAAAYGKAEAISLCIDNRIIKRDACCQ